MAVPNSSYTEIITTTIDNYSSTIADNVETNNTLLARLRMKGNTDPVDGGVNILENLEYAENSTFQWYSGLETLNVSASDVLTSAPFAWKQANANVVISGLEQLQNAGKEKMHDLLKARIRNAERTMRNQIGSALFNSNTESGGKAIGGLQHLVADLPTSGVVGGVDAGNETWWRNQYYDFSAQTITASASTITAAMNDIFINTTRNGETVDYFVGGSTYFEYYLSSLQANQRFTDDGNTGPKAGAGFKSLKFWGGAADVFFDANCAGTRMYALNTDYVKYRPHKSRNFVTLPDKVSVNQDAIVVPMLWAGNMTISNRSLCGVIVA